MSAIQRHVQTYQSKTSSNNTTEDTSGDNIGNGSAARGCCSTGLGGGTVTGVGGVTDVTGGGGGGGGMSGVIGV